STGGDGLGSSGAIGADSCTGSLAAAGSRPDLQGSGPGSAHPMLLQLDGALEGVGERTHDGVAVADRHGTARPEIGGSVHAIQSLSVVAKIGGVFRNVIGASVNALGGGGAVSSADRCAGGLAAARGRPDLQGGGAGRAHPMLLQL